jgi:hypothetical protein
METFVVIKGYQMFGGRGFFGKFMIIDLVVVDIQSLPQNNSLLGNNFDKQPFHIASKRYFLKGCRRFC